MNRDVPIEVIGWCSWGDESKLKELVGASRTRTIISGRRAKFRSKEGPQHKLFSECMDV